MVAIRERFYCSKVLLPKINVSILAEKECGPGGGDSVSFQNSILMCMIYSLLLTFTAAENSLSTFSKPTKFDLTVGR